jgi:hypothetical protein
MSKPSAAILLEDGQFRNGRQVVVGHRAMPISRNGSPAARSMSGRQRVHGDLEQALDRTF